MTEPLFPLPALLPEGPIDEVPCGRTAPNPPRNPFNLIKQPRPPLPPPSSGFHLQRGRAFPEPPSRDKFLPPPTNYGLNAAALGSASPEFAGRGDGGTRVCGRGVAHRNYWASVLFLAEVLGLGEDVMGNWVLSAWEKPHLCKDPWKGVWNHSLLLQLSGGCKTAAAPEMQPPLGGTCGTQGWFGETLSCAAPQSCVWDLGA